MIKYGWLHYSGWDAVKAAWKRKVFDRDISLISGTDLADVSMHYHVGEGFIIYPDPIWQWDGHVCQLYGDDEETELHTGRNGDNTDTYLSWNSMI